MDQPLNYQVHHNGPLKPEVIKYLHDMRIANHWTYKQLGERLGISQAFAHNILNKNMNISTNTYMARVAKGIERLEAGDVGLAKPPAGNLKDVRMQEHAYHLRDELRVSFSLPTDLTEREAERLALFMQSLAK